MKMLALLSCCLVILPASAAAELITIHCSDPQGFNLYHGPDELTEKFDKNVTSHADRFGSKPTFVLDTKKPGELLVLWGTFIPPGVSEELIQKLDLKAKAEQASIVFRNRRQISAIHPYKGGVNLYTLYPKLGYGVFTTHTHWQTSGKVNAYLYYGECRFTQVVQ